jgi:replicative DNA helicase
MIASEPLKQSQQENLLSLIAYSDDHGKLVATVDPTLFEGDFRIIAERAIKYWQEHNQAPKNHTADLLSDILEDESNRKAPTFRRVLSNMMSLWESGINTDYVLDELRRFTRVQSLKKTVLQSAEILTSNPSQSIEQVEALFSKILHTHEATFDPGLRADDIEHLVNHLTTSEQPEFSTNIPILDKRGVVPTRETIMVFLAVTGAGKTWWQVNLGRAALLMRKKVVHVTLELSEEETQKRYYQSFLAVPARDRDLHSYRTKLKLDSEQRLLGFDSEDIEASFSMQKPNRKALKDLIAHIPLRNLKIKQFPTRSLTVQQLRQYLIGLEAVNFLPDLLIVDYVGIMRTDSDNYRITLGRLVEELRGLASERKIAISTAQQVNRQGSKEVLIGMAHIAEDWSIAGTADYVLTLTRSEQELERRLARLWVSKNRSGEQDFGVVLAQHYQHGQFALESCGLDHEEYLSLLGGKA